MSKDDLDKWAMRAIFVIWTCIWCFVAILITGCGGGGDDPEAESVKPTEYRLEVLPWTSSYHGNIEICPAPWYAPKHMAITATLDYAPNMTVYVNYRKVDSLPVAVYKDDAVYICATMPAPLTIYSGSATIRVVWEPEDTKQTTMPVNCQPDPKACA